MEPTVGGEGVSGPHCTWPSTLGESLIDTRVRSRILLDLDSRITALARPSRNCTNKLQTRPFVIKGAQQDNRRCPTVIKIWSCAQEGWPTPSQTAQLSVVREITSSRCQILEIAPGGAFGDKRRQFQKMERTLWARSCCGCGTGTVREHRKGNVRRSKPVSEDW
jgi:hypothetical protein